MRLGRSIPRSQPREAVAVHLPEEWDAIVDAPLVAGDLVLLSGRWERPPRQGRFRLLAAFSAVTGQPVWSVETPERSPWVASSAPVLCPDGKIRVAIWTLQGPISVLTVSESGAVESLDHTRVESGVLLAWWPLASPPAARLDAIEIRLSARGKKGGHFVSGRIDIGNSAFLARTDFRRNGETVWTDGEWLLGETAGVAVCEETGAFGRRVIGRDRMTGERLWSGQVGGERRGVIAVGKGEALFLDEREREKAREARAEAYRDELIRTERDIPWEDFARPRPLTEPSSIVAVDAANGNETWRWDLPGDVHGVLLAPHIVVAAVAGARPGIHVAERGGAELGRHALLPDAVEGSQPEQRLRAGTGPRPVTADHTHVLWCDRGELVCAVIGEIERVMWRQRLPGECRAPVLRGSGDEYRCAISAADERIFLAEGGRLHIWTTGVPLD